MLRPQGFVQIFSDRPTVERDTITCGHCQAVIFVKPASAATVYLVPQIQGPDKEEPGAACRVCMRAVCLRCCAIGTCTPWERRLERAESRDRFLRSAGIA